MEVAMVEITVSMIGDVLIVDETNIIDDHIPRRVTPNSPLKIGMHKNCGHTVKIHFISQKYNVLVCDQCCLRAPFPGSIEMITEMKEYFDLQFKGV